jgi:EmrB/QacA subfamily drug resistance transporter
LLTAGSVGDRFGRRRGLLVGLATFLSGSIVAAAATSTAVLIAARGVMGLGGALIMPTTLSILVNAFGDPRERANAIAVWTAASGAGIALGPIVGGALMRHFSWSSVFWINIPLLVAALVGALHVVPDSRDPHATKLDPAGALLSMAAAGSLVYAIIRAPEHGWTSAETVITFAIGAVTSLAFFAWEAHRREPMLDLRLFRHRGFSIASVTLAILFFAMAGAVFLQAQYLQFILRYSPLVAGIALIPAAVGILMGTGAGAHLSATLGGRAAVASGTLLAATGLATQAAFIDGTSYLPTGVGLLLFGLGAGVAMPSATDIIMATLPPARAGVGSAVNDTVRELGGALGVAVIGSVAATSYTSAVRADLTRFPELTEPVRASVADNVGAAIDVSHHIGPNGTEIATLVRTAFVDSMTGALWVATAAAVLATILALVYLPRAAHVRRAEHSHGSARHHGAEHPPVGAHEIA